LILKGVVATTLVSPVPDLCQKCRIWISRERHHQHSLDQFRRSKSDPASNAFDPVDPAGRGCNLFGKQVAMKRPDQPAELATAYVMLADLLASYISGAAIAVTGGKPIL
jgi:NAD(P)-dependent dehydrogenase (short-subunit alcohol dehydrogenase family)